MSSCKFISEGGPLSIGEIVSDKVSIAIPL